MPFARTPVERLSHNLRALFQQALTTSKSEGKKEVTIFIPEMEDRLHTTARINPSPSWDPDKIASTILELQKAFSSQIEIERSDRNSEILLKFSGGLEAILEKFPTTPARGAAR